MRDESDYQLPRSAIKTEPFPSQIPAPNPVLVLPAPARSCPVLPAPARSCPVPLWLAWVPHEIGQDGLGPRPPRPLGKTLTRECPRRSSHFRVRVWSRFPGS